MDRIDNPEVAAAFDAYPPKLRERLLELRSLILEIAAGTEGVGQIEEALRWGEPSYLTSRPKSGTTVRIAPVRGSDDAYAMYVHCQTNLLDVYRDRYPQQLNFLGDRGLRFDVDEAIPAEQVADCIALALRYHADKKSKPSS
jgi:hypothetical protein